MMADFNNSSTIYFLKFRFKNFYDVQALNYVKVRRYGHANKLCAFSVNQGKVAKDALDNILYNEYLRTTVCKSII